MLEIRQRDLQDPLCGIDNSILHHKIANSLDGVTGKKFEATRKRKRSIDEYTDDSDGSDLDLEAQGIKVASKPSKTPSPSRFEGVRIPGLIYPKSAYQSHVATLPVVSEIEVLEDFLVRLFRYLDHNVDETERLFPRQQMSPRMMLRQPLVTRSLFP